MVGVSNSNRFRVVLHICLYDELQQGIQELFVRWIGAPLGMTAFLSHPYGRAHSNELANSNCLKRNGLARNSASEQSAGCDKVALRDFRRVSKAGRALVFTQRGSR